MNIIGRGNTAEVFEYNEGKVCKLFYEKFSNYYAKKEYSNAKCIENLGLPIPKAYEMINIKQRVGIIYDRLYGESVMDKIVRNEDVVWCMEKFCDIHKKVINCHTNKLTSYKDFLLQCISAEKDKNVLLPLQRKIEDLPYGDILCHGDYHPGNVWSSGKDIFYVIDFMNICNGVWQYDVARTYFLLSEGSLPKNVSEENEVFKKRKQLADLYLKNMQVAFNEIEDYVSIVRICREYEMR